MVRNVLLFLFSTVLVMGGKQVMAQSRDQMILSVPAGNEYARIAQNAVSVLPSGRYLTPAGKTIQITHDPFGMAVSPDGRKTVTLHNGVFTIIDNETLANTRVPSYDKKIISPLSNGSFLGVAFGKENNIVFLSGGDNGAVIIYDIQNLKRIDSISLNGRVNGIDYDESFTSDLLFNESKNELLVLDRGNFRLVRIDLATDKITASIQTGRQPFGLAISPDHSMAFVANVGMYDYPVLPDIKDLKKDSSLYLPWHPYGDGTKEAIEGYTMNGRKIPGVGSPLAPEAMSVYTIDLNTDRVIDRYKPGYQIGEMVEGAEVVGGASPNSVAVGEQYAYVTNATNDNISIIDYRHHRLAGQIPVKVHRLIDGYRGLLPFGITLSKDEKTLYVALLGFNAVAVIDVQTKTTRGLIPTGWGPARVLLSKDEKKLYVISCRGYGAGPNGGKGFVRPVQGTYIGDIQLGTFQKIDLPGTAALAHFTSQAIENTFTVKTVTDDKSNPLPLLPGLRQSPIKYIVYITKENRTYDEMLGQLPSGRGDSTLARFGMHVTVTGRDNTFVNNANVSPNHLKIAKQFSFSDNFYCDSDASIHGHHWMMGVIPNEWVEANSNVNKSANLLSKVPGRRFPGSTGSMDPEDFAERGGIWEAMERSKTTFYNFGEANETAHVREQWYDTSTGSGHVVMVPMQKALWPNTSHNYAGFNTNIPDQFRMEQFESEFTRLWLKGKKALPHLITMQLPNDHTAGPRPADGYPYTHSYVADNDLALGRILHFLSRTPYWKNMLVVITEDDPQGGVDHIDAHRSLLMLAGPYVKKSHTSHVHANFGSILKMIYNLLNVPYVNQYDATASQLQDFFTSQPDYTPYTVEFPAKEVFDPAVAMKKYNKNIDWKKILKGPEMDDEDEQRKAHQKEPISKEYPATDKPTSKLHLAPLPVSRHPFTVIAHRADHVVAPENSLAAIDSAILHGADYVELDLRTSADSGLVIMHDGSLDRTTYTKGPVAKMAMADLDTCHLRNSTETIPHFEDCLKRCRNKINIYLDFKDADVRQTLTVLRKYDFEKSVLVYINSPRQYVEWRKWAPDMPLIISLPGSVKNADQLKEYLLQYPAEVLDGSYAGYTTEMVKLAKEMGVAVWPDIQSPMEMNYWQKALETGFTGLQTDHPQQLIQWLQNKTAR